jgi:hypothetical protein
VYKTWIWAEEKECSSLGLGFPYQRFSKMTIKSHYPPQDALGSDLRGQRDRGISRVGRLEYELMPMLTQKLHCRFLPE